MKQDMCPVIQKLSVALVLLALFGAAHLLCFRTEAFSTAVGFAEINGEKPEFLLDICGAKEKRHFLAHLSPIEQKFIQGSDELNSISLAKELCESEPDNVLFVSFYAELLVKDFYSDHEDKPDIKTIRQILDHWKKLDPDNGMPCFLLAYVELLTGYKMEIVEQGKKSVYKFTVLDPAAIERGIKEYRIGLTKKYAKAYAKARHQERLRLADIPTTPDGIIKKIQISASTLLPHLMMERDLARYVSYHAKTLHTKGKIREASELLASGRKYLLLRMKEKENYLISALVHAAVNTIWLESAKEMKNETFIKVYSPITEHVEQWKKMPDPNSEIIARYGGVLAVMLCPALKHKIDPELLTPERMINYILVDQVFLIFLFNFILLLSLFLLLLGLIGLCFKRFPDWELPVESCFRIFLFGLIIPLAIYLIYIHIDFLSGRDMSPAWNPLRTAVPYLYLLFILPLWFFIAALVELRVILKKRFFSIIWSMLALFTGFIFITGAILSPVSEIKIKYYLEQDKLCNTDEGFTSLETEVTKNFYRSMYQDLTGKKMESGK